MATVPVSYQLGPISAGANSPLGGFFGFINGLSNNFQAGVGIAGSDYATGLNAAVNAPAASADIITGQRITSADVIALRAAQDKGLAADPFVQIGQVVGGGFGTLSTGVGTIFGAGAKTAGPGVGSAVGVGVAGAGQGIGAAAQTAGPGVGTGIGAALGGGLQGFGSAISGALGASPFLLLAGGFILLLLFMTL